MGCVARRDSTSLNQANGSTVFRLHIAMKLNKQYPGKAGKERVGEADRGRLAAGGDVQHGKALG